jgi:hypothetical protein
MPARFLHGGYQCTEAFMSESRALVSGAARAKDHDVTLGMDPPQVPT